MNSLHHRKEGNLRSPATHSQLRYPLYSYRVAFQLFDVPFDFIVGNQTFPAGRYTLDRGPAQGTVTIRSEDCAHAAIGLTQSVSSVVTRENGSLVFHRYGDTYIFSEVWNPGNDGRRLVSPSREKELTVTVGHPHNATVAALR